MFLFFSWSEWLENKTYFAFIQPVAECAQNYQHFLSKYIFEINGSAAALLNRLSQDAYLLTEFSSSNLSESKTKINGRKDGYTNRHTDTCLSHTRGQDIFVACSAKPSLQKAR